VGRAARQLGKQVEASKAACPGERFVLVGYSQGAWIIDRYLKDTPSVHSRVAAVLVYGDPVAGEKGVGTEARPRPSARPSAPPPAD
jgi:hypothetical protein